MVTEPPLTEVNLPDALRDALVGVTQRPVILVASDFDGVLAPLVDDPAMAQPIPGAVELLTELSSLPETHVALVSGRDLETLTDLAGLDPDGPVTRIGSHGAESSRRLSSAVITAEQRALLARVTGDLEDMVGRFSGARLERKPTATVLHTRGGDPREARAAADGAHEIARRHAGITALIGKDVVELSVISADKGSALKALADDVGADAIVYLGDDVTDEYAFEALGPDDVTVKVGDGETAAQFRVQTPAEAIAVLRRVRELRRELPRSTPEPPARG